MMSKVVRSTSNPGIKEALRLRNRRARKETGLFLIEGFREVRRALDADIQIDKLWFCPELYLGSHEGELVDRAAVAGAEAIEAAADPFRKMSYRDRPEGLLAVAKQFDTSLHRITLGSQPLVLVVESIEKPGNLGTMIRAASAAGVDAVIAADPTTDVFNPNVVRSSIGTCFVVPIGVGSTGDVVGWLRDNEIGIVASAPDADTKLWAAKLDEAVAVVVGSEQYGLSTGFLDAADVRVSIPMPGGAVDSLNAATSAAILLFEAVRQRSL
jgi:TrmH family RNA methyltransferase